MSYWNDFYRDDEDVKYVECVSLAILVMISLAVNSYLIITLCITKKLKIKHQNFVLEIMFFTIIWLPFAGLLAATRLTDGWVFGDIACRLSFYMTGITSFLKIVYMSIISVERCIKIVRWYDISGRTRILLMIIPVIVVTSTTGYMIIPNTFTQLIHYQGDEFYICTVAYKYSETVRWSVVFLSITFIAYFVIPGIIIIACYVKILLEIRKSARELAEQSRTSAVPTADGSVVYRRHNKEYNGSNGSCSGGSRGSKGGHTTIVLIIIAVLFTVMYVPLFAGLLVRTLDNVSEKFQTSSRVIIACVCLVLINTIIEPLLFILTASRYRKKLLNSIRCFCNRKST
jgi:hypothetical protein